MKWVTRSHVHVDRVACPWLITRFIDSDAEFIFVPKSQVQEVAEREGAIPAGIVVPERVPVTLGTEYFNVIRWPFRQLVESGDLKPLDVLIVEPEPQHESGVVLAGREWTIRPGELIPVALDLGEAPSGFYVPISAISERNGRTAVFLVDGDTAREVEVETHESYRDLLGDHWLGLEEDENVDADSLFVGPLDSPPQGSEAEEAQP